MLNTGLCQFAFSKSGQGGGILSKLGWQGEEDHGVPGSCVTGWSCLKVKIKTDSLPGCFHLSGDKYYYSFMKNTFYIPCVRGTFITVLIYRDQQKNKLSTVWVYICSGLWVKAAQTPLLHNTVNSKHHSSSLLVT